MEILIGVSLLTANVLLLTLFVQSCKYLFAAALRQKTKFLIQAALLLLTINLLASCGSSSPSIGLLSIGPVDATVFVGVPTVAGSGAIKHGRQARGLSTAAQQDSSALACGNLQYSATAIYTNGSVTDVSALVTWSSSNTAAASISSSGQVSAAALGITYIQAGLGTATSGGVPLFVDELNSMSITPTPVPTLPLGSVAMPYTLQLSAAGLFTREDGTTPTRDLTNLVTWSSTDPGVATVAPGGLASTVSQGTTTIVASICGISAAATVTVGPPGPESLQITPATPTIGVGLAVPLTAVELYSDGTTHPLTGTLPLQWSSSSKASMVSQTGVAFGFSTGTSTITAQENGGNGLAGTTTVSVVPAEAQFAYVANLQGNGSGSISSFTTNVATGVLTPLASTPATSPQQVILDKSGTFLYSIDSNSYVHVYQVTLPSAATGTTPAGTITLLDNATPTPYTPVIAGGGGTNVGTIDPTGQFLYVVDRTADTLYGFQIQQYQNGATPIGSLQPISNGAPFSGTGFSFDQPSWVMTDRTGRYLYVINAGNNSISGFVINFDGTLTPVVPSGTPPPTGNGPTYGTTDTNSHMFVANSVDNTVNAYLISPGGSWQSLGTLSVSGATSIINVLTHPNGQFVYVLDKGGAAGGQVFAYTLTPPTGGTIFGSQIAAPQPVGITPTGIVIDPSGSLLAVDNSGSNDLSLFVITQGSSNPLAGALTPATPSTVPTDGSPHFVVFYNAVPISRIY